MQRFITKSVIYNHKNLKTTKLSNIKEMEHDMIKYYAAIKIITWEETRIA